MNTANKKSSNTRRFRMFSEDLSQVLHRVTKPILGKQGATIATIIKHWPQIVGAYQSTHIVFKELHFTHHASNVATLVIEVSPHLKPEIPYLTPMILEQCQIILGNRNIEKILALPMQASRT